MSFAPERIWTVPYEECTALSEVAAEYGDAATEYVRADTVPEWVSVEDEMPELERDVLVVWGNGDIDRGRYYGRFKNYQAWLIQNGRDCYSVTHWRPLPPPPETEAT